MERPLIQFVDATFAYGDTIALEKVSMEVMEGEFLGIIGPNGSGKTTMLRAILGLILPKTGTLQILDCSCEKLRCHHRAQIGYLPQKGLIDPHFPLTAREAVLMGRYSSIGLFRRPTQKDLEIVERCLAAVGMENHQDTPLGFLSGGHQQRILIARALAQQPRVLLLDEPTTGIDTPTQHSLMDLIRGLHRELRLTVLFVTHDINLISPIADRLALLKTRLYAIGPRKEVISEETLSQIYGKEIVLTDKGAGYVIIGDHHHS